MSGTFQVVNIEEWTGAAWGSGGGMLQVKIPDPLVEWLTDLAVLRAVPLHYLVPDEGLLPLESIRFVSLDPILVGRLLDGALAAAALGGGDLALGARYRAGVLRRVARELAWRELADRQQKAWSMATFAGVLTPAVTLATLWEGRHAHADDQAPWHGEVAGLLIRSELVRRYPSMAVRASAGGRPLGCVRRERLAPTIMLALFHGATVPDRLELQEPDEGVRFGVENATSAGGGYDLDYRPPPPPSGGAPPVGAPGRIPVPTRSAPDDGVLALGGFASVIATRQGFAADSTSVARCLQQAPFVQIIGHGARPPEWEPTP